MRTLTEDDRLRMAHAWFGQAESEFNKALHHEQQGNFWCAQIYLNAAVNCERTARRWAASVEATLI